jgi:hypothetical protein
MLQVMPSADQAEMSDQEDNTEEPDAETSRARVSG